MNPAVVQALDDVRRYCDARLPRELRDEVVLEASARGTTIEIIERRAPWSPAYGREWSSTPVARLHFDRARGCWTLKAHSGGRWVPHPDTPTVRDVAALFRVLDDDPYALFWG